MKKWAGFFILAASCLSAANQSTIPVVDMQDFYDEERHEIFMEELSGALRKYGFFAVKNSDINIEVVKQAFEAMIDFCALDPEVKMLYDASSTNGQRGYVALRKEVAKGSLYPDLKEFYHVAAEREEEQYERLGYLKNVWPNECDFQRPVLAYINELDRYRKPLERAFSELLGQEKQFITNMTDEGDSLMRLIHYPAPNQKDPNDQAIWAQEHTDIDMYTILPPATADGLEVQLENGEWIAVHVPDDTFIVNMGDFFQNLSNGYFRSGPHRVKSPLGQNHERYSIVYFVHPRSLDKMDPLPHMIEKTGGQKLFADATRIELLMERLADLNLASYDMLEDLADSKIIERLIEVNRASPDAMNRLKENGLASQAVLDALAGK
ncbi:MAG: isopenicillin N synthase family oxygenase [Chlamydiae bacterium]|nr:isopenicillin N synthase family oxygenase [Chlamydiota bacterium]